ncbi:peptidoglycan-binding protein [Dactylosporangium siamense]|uniref:peptidoglycan-binding protein n=1 Tax=Dactylosporangium siamense TaxID=685454 RepID=UPI001EF3783B|nr:peptidoglycan-binding protein [Dactylosporangium siamense]
MRAGKAVWAVAAVAVAGAAGAAAVGFGGDRPGPRTATGLPPATAQVTRQTMHDVDEEPGDLGYGRTTTLSGRVPGVITGTPLPGDVIERGRAVYRVDDRPVVLLYGAVAAYRPLTPGTTGADVRQLEENLRVLGYGGFPVDTSYTAATATAVRRWQKDLGLPQTGEVDLGRVLFSVGAIRVDTVTAGVNESTGGGDEVLRFTGTDRTVTVHLAVSKQRLARNGVQVQVRLPDGRTVPGRVDRVYTVIEQAQDTPPQTRVEALVSLADPAAAAGIEAAVVEVTFTAAERADVLTVPVAALVALAEGGYGLEVVDGTATRYIKVEPGLFAGGRVEVTGDGLTEGMTVGMPR